MNKGLVILIGSLFLFDSCLSHDYNAKDEANKNYKSFLVRHEKNLEAIVGKCYLLKIKYALTDSISKLCNDQEFKETIQNIEYVKFISVLDYTAYNIKLKEINVLIFF